jgi:hypothetical protein
MTHVSLRAESEIRLKIDLLESQLSSIAEMLVKVIEHKGASFAEPAERLAANPVR